MTPEQFRALLSEFSLTQTALAKRWGVSRRTIIRWCQPGGKPPQWTKDALNGIWSSKHEW